jgi:phosphate transport system protein
MERHFDEQLATLKHQLVKMSALAEIMIGDAVRALVERDPQALVGLDAREEQVNRFQVDIDEACLTLIALHQPAAGDLRFILGAAKTNSDLERLADQAINIADKTRRLITQPALKPLVLIPRMADIARGMVTDSLHAFVNRDVFLARAVLLRDDQVDALKAEVTAEMLRLMTADPAIIERAMGLILIARNLERIGDHATNIAENTIFVVEGRDVRHQGDGHKV